MISKAKAGFNANFRLELRTLARDIYIAPRRLSARRGVRLEPRFIILGAQKAGTTSLFRYLAQHPDVGEPVIKEVHYFDSNYHKGPDWYRAHFPRDRNDGAISGEGSPYYLFHPHSAERMASELPDARLIVLLRNPIDRAISQYGHERRQGGETRAMDEAFDAELPRVRAAEAEMEKDKSLNSRVHRRESYLSRGIYAPQLRRYLERYDREQLLVLRYDKFFEEPAEGFARVLNHIGLNPYEVPFARHGAGDGRDDGGIDREQLARFFRPYNEELSDMLGENFTDWE